MVKTFLCEHFLFRRVAEEYLAELLSAVSVVTVPSGEKVYDRTNFRRCLGILMDGVLQVRKDALLISTLRCGEVFGAAALFGGEEYPTTLTARSDCRLLLIPQEAVGRLLRTCGEFAEDYTAYLSGRIRFLGARLDALSADRGEGKLARYLLTAQRGGCVTQNATQLCQRIGIGRATLYRAFELLEADGAIRREGKTIHLLNAEKLRAHGDGIG